MILGFSGYLVFVSPLLPSLSNVTEASSLRVSLSALRTIKLRPSYLSSWFCELERPTYGDALNQIIFSYGLMQSFGNLVRGNQATVHVFMRVQGPGDMLGLTSSE